MEDDMYSTATKQMPSDAGRDCLALARGLRERIAKESAAIEREGRLPPDLVDDLRQAGLFHMFVPRDLGGIEVDPVTAAQVVEEIAKADGSTAWCLMLAAQAAFFSGFLPRREALAIWGNGGIVAGTARPIGRAVWTEVPEPGYIVSGRWPFASGSGHATWFGGECVVYDGERPRLDTDGNEVTRTLFVPRESVSVDDTWDTLGLRGTASNDFSIENTFVPAGRGMQGRVDPPLHAWALYRCAPLVFINHGSHAIGLGRGAIEAAAAIVQRKLGWGNQPLRDIPRIQAAIAEATALVDSAADHLYSSAGALWESSLSGDAEPTLRARVRLATSHAVKASVQGVDLLHATMATSAIFRSSPLERQFRDIHTAAAHVMVGPLTYEAAGRALLGLEANLPHF